MMVDIDVQATPEALRGADGPDLWPPKALAARLPALGAEHLAQEDRRRLRGRISIARERQPQPARIRKNPLPTMSSTT
jgi:hypothetical protein